MKTLPTAKRVVLVGNKISPGNPVTKPDGTVVRTLWGELAWQLGGKKAFARVAADDEKATSPGDVLRELFNEYGPCLILIDEWVAYARQLHDQSDLPAGGFETQFTFAQALTESAKLAKNCLLVISLPASDTAGLAAHAGRRRRGRRQRGREALDRLRNVVGRVESSWRPASAEEGFEIVRRRLFEPLADPAQFKDRDVVARAFADLYRTQQPGVPARVPRRRLREADQGRLPDPPGDLRPALHRLVHAGEVPAHPRRAAPDGGGDPQPVGEGRPQPADPAGEHPDRRSARAVRADALPVGQLGAGHREGRGRPELAAAADRRRGAEPRQVRRDAGAWRARSTWARRPTAAAAHRGHRGPAGEARLRDAGRVAGGVRRCAAAARRRRRPTSTRTARATGTRPSPRSPSSPRTAPSSSSAIPTRWLQELDERLRADLRKTGDFSAHPPAAALGRRRARRPRRAARRAAGGPPLQQGDRQRRRGGGARRSSSRAATRRASTATRSCSSPPTRRGCRTSTRRCASTSPGSRSWRRRMTLNLDPHQVKQAETQKQAADGAVTARLPETYQWLLVPEQANAAGADRRGRRSGCPGRMRWRCARARSSAATSCW